MDGVRHGTIVGFSFLKVCDDVGVPLKALSRWLDGEQLLREKKSGETGAEFARRQGHMLKVQPLLSSCGVGNRESVCGAMWRGQLLIDDGDGGARSEMMMMTWAAAQGAVDLASSHMPPRASA